MNVLERIADEHATRSSTLSITSIEDYIAALQAYAFGNGAFGVQQTMGGEPAERAPNDLVAYAQQAYASSGPVFALMAVRLRVFSAVRFLFQRMRQGRPNDLFGTPALRLLERPWTGGTTQDLLATMILDADLAGNFYGVPYQDEIVRLRPDWVTIILEPRRFRGGVLGYRKLGYVYEEGGLGVGGDPVPLLPDEVCHFAPMPDPLATYRGMSWLTPVIREMLNDKLMSRHQQKFFENAATPNMVVSLDASVSYELFQRFIAKFKERHEGVDNAYRTLMVGGGADVTVVGQNFEQMAFTAVQGRGETRLAAAAGVPPSVVGFSEGLQGSSLNAGNYGSAKRQFGDTTMHHLWSNAAGCLEVLTPAPGPDSRLWYDARGVPFLREDAQQAAEVQNKQANSIRQLVDAGYTADSVVAAVLAEDYSLLVHSGLFSVQLQPPGTGDGGSDQ